MLPVELRQLRYFLLLADELNFSRAARKAHISQSSVSEQLQRLEDLLGVRLVDRNRRSVRLTSAGLTLQEQSRKLFEQVGDLIKMTREADGKARRSLRVAYCEMALGSLMPTILREFKRQHPLIAVNLVEHRSKACEEALLRGDYDCIFVPTVRGHPELTTVELARDLICVCVPQSSQLSSFERLTIEQIGSEPLILPDGGSVFTDQIMSAFARAGVRPNIACNATSISGILTRVAAAEGLGFIPKSCIGRVPPGIGIARLGEPDITVTFSIVWRNGSDGATLNSLISIAQSYSTQRDPYLQSPASGAA